MRIFNNDSYYEVRDCISHDYIELFNRHGIQPVLIPNNLSNPIDYFENLNCKALILTGGDDVLITYEEIKNKNISFKNERDKVEYLLTDYCVKNEIPILGICRGMQLINLYFKGKIDNLSEMSKTINHVNVNHSIKIVDNEFVINNAMDVIVNSYHNNGVLLKDISTELKCFAISEDNVVEGLYKRDKILGIQWHPERSISLYNDFIMEKWLACVNKGEGK